MKVSRFLGSSRFFKASDISEPIVRTIAEVTAETIGNEPERLVLRFEDESRRLSLNQTNAVRCADAWGDEADDWLGQAVELSRELTEFEGKEMYGIRLRLPAAEPAKAVPVPKPSAPSQPSAQAQPPAKAQPPARAQPPATPQPSAQAPAQQRTPEKRTNHLRERVLRAQEAKKGAKPARAPEADYPSEA